MMKRVPAQHALSWWSVASSRPVVLRALGFMGVVGATLIAINHGDALIRGDIDGVRLFKMILTPLVPYAVSTLSSVSAIRNAQAASQRLEERDPFSADSTET